MRTASPLRYPGGKWRVAPFFKQIIEVNGFDGFTYVEPYAGGASLALTLLLQKRVSEVHLNDLDPAVHAFWWSVLTKTKEFLQRLREVEVTPEEWFKQREVYRRGTASGKFALGFAMFFLNRTNHSGILNGGMIGGKAQKGMWKLDARFNRADLEVRIRRICSVKSRILLSRRDALDFVREYRSLPRTLIYLDPPYYGSGRRLYLNAYEPSDHLAVRRQVACLSSPWVVSYDDVPEIRQLYKSVRCRHLKLLHTAREAREGSELLFFSDDLRIPGRGNFASA